MKIVFTAILENISTRTDNSVKLTLGSQEMDSSNAAQMFELRNKFVKILISDNNISPLEDKLLDELKLKDGKKVKTHSQRLRAVLYRQWEQENTGIDFDTYYGNKMDAAIESVKSKLD